MQQPDSKFHSGLFHGLYHSTPKYNLDKQGQNLDFIKIRNELEMNIQRNLLKFLSFCPWCISVRNQLKKGGAGGDGVQPELNVSTSHHIYRRPFLSSWGVFALAFSDTAQNVGRSTGADGHRETHRTERRYQQPTLAGLPKSFHNKQAAK